MGKQSFRLFMAFGLFFLACLFAGIATQSYYLIGLPFFALLVFQTVVNFRPIFFLLLISLPISYELYLPGGLGTDLPSEPLMIGLMTVFIIFALHRAGRLGGQFIRHPITLLLALHYLWILIAAINSSQPLFSFKYLLAKSWYVIVFYFMAGYLLRRVKDYKNFFKAIFIPLILTVLIILARHALKGFSFREVHFIMGPFYRNHVMYASILVTFLPFVWFSKNWVKKGSVKWWTLLLSVLIFLAAIYFSFTRAAYICVLIAIGGYFVIRYRLVKYALGASAIVVLVMLTYIVNQNRYLDYTPDFERTITHHKFDNLVEATYKMEDISTMERLHRWVAGGLMVTKKPWMGFGPGNFYSFYQSFTVSSFKTYVSNNPEKSGIHNYYLMTAVEQGIPGLLIFLALCFFALLSGERIYHQTSSLFKKSLIMATLLSLIIIYSLQLINDMIETDKIGPFFFMCLAILVRIDIQNSNAKLAVPA